MMTNDTTSSSCSSSRRGDKQVKMDESQCINTLRMLSADQPSAGSSGHPGAPMGCAPMAHVLFHKIMKFNPKNPHWCNRDRFVLSNGHACALQYSILHLAGYDVDIEDLKAFRRLDSKCPGHPENFVTPGVEVSTGPLGQGLSNAVGMAIAEKHLAATFNRDNSKIVDHHTYVICGDGCLQEGVTSEACSLAGHLGLGKLIVLYDDNKITIDGSTDLSFTEDVSKRYEAYGWQVLSIEDGNYDVEGIHNAVLTAQQETERPTLIKIRTTIGLGSALQNTYKVHGAPLKPEDMANTKAFYGLNPELSFHVPEDVKTFYDKTKAGQEWESDWKDLFARYQSENPTKAKEFLRCMKGELPSGWKEALPVYTDSEKPMATRKYSEIALNAVAAVMPELIGGSADLTPSNLTKLTMSGDFQKDTPIGRYLRFGVREHAMSAICNGIFAHGGLRPFCATFFNFIGYALGAVRLSALSRFGVLYIATHDSLFLGEDGPTHQPIEMLASLRSMPQIYTFRPADGNEVSGAYAWALEHADRPTVLALTRQAVSSVPHSSINNTVKGAYIVQEDRDKEGLQLILVASGSEVGLALETAKVLGEKEVKVRVISMPCRKLFEEQPLEYRTSLFLNGGSFVVPTMSVEAAATFGWSEYAHANFGLDTFGASGNLKDLKAHFGFHAAAVAKEAENLLEYYKGREAPNLFDKPPPRRLLMTTTTH